MNKKVISLLVILFAVALPKVALSEELDNLWITGNGPSFDLTDSISTKSHMEIRLPDFEQIEYVRFSQKFYTKLGASWKLGTHPVYETAKLPNGDWGDSYRFDLELNPGKFKLGKEGPTVSMRNRWELRWLDGRGSEVFHRVRQLTSVTWDIKAGPFTSYAFGNEIFYEEHKGKISLNRFYPIQLGSKIGDKIKMSYYLLYQSRRAGTTSDWSGTYILGTSISL